MLPAMFALGIFHIGSYIYAWTSIFIYASCVAGMTRTHSFYWLKWSLPNFLPGMASNLNPPNLYLPNS
jgi:hypothetical protein